MKQLTTKQADRPRQLTYEERCARYPIDFTVDDEGRVLVPQSWRSANLRQLIIPTAAGGKIATVHKDAIAVFDAWLALMSERGIDKDILTYDGGFVPRLKRGVDQPKDRASKAAWGKLLSNHSRGTAIDLNAKWNPMGKYGATNGTEGSLARVIACAREVRVGDLGIVCGADWKGRSRDDMHFEIGVWP